MFLTPISSDAVMQTEGRPFGFRQPGEPPRALWFETLTTLKNHLPDDWSVRLAASVLLRQWGGSDTAVAAALIADDETLMSLPAIPDNVCDAARRFSQLVTPNDAAQTSETWTILHRLAQITAAAREAAEFIRHRYTLPPTLTPEAVRNWQAVLAALYAHHRITGHPVANAYSACRDAVAALADRIAPSDFTWRVTGDAADVKAFLTRAVPRCGLSYRCENDETLFVRTTKLPLSTAVRLIDGVASAYPTLLFIFVTTDPKKVFRSSIPAAYTREIKDGEDTDPVQMISTVRIDPFDDYRARMEPLFYAENVNPVPAILASAKRPRPLCCRVHGETPEILKAFLTTAVPLFRLDVTPPSDEGKSVVIRGSQSTEALPATAAASLLRLLKIRFPALTFTDVAPTSVKFKSGAVPDAPDFPWCSTDRSLWEETLTERFAALDDSQKRSRFLTPVLDSVYCYCRQTGQTAEDLPYPTDDAYDDYENEADEDGLPRFPLPEEDDDEGLDGDRVAYDIAFPTLDRPDGTRFYDAGDIPARTALRKRLAEEFPSAEFSGPLSLLSDDDAPVKLRGNSGAFRLSLSRRDAVRFEREFLDADGRSLNPLWECRGGLTEDDWLDVPDDYDDLA